MKYIISFILILFLLVLVVWYFGMPTPPATPPPSITSVTIGTTTVVVEVADTAAAREQGLSNRESLAQGSGMLFVFDTAQNVAFWMKDMRFSLDMLFADASGKIVTIVSDVPPSSYRKDPPELFRPSQPAKYVLEVPAGYAAAHGIAEGMTIVVQ